MSSVSPSATLNMSIEPELLGVQNFKASLRNLTINGVFLHSMMRQST
ncbi:hypothetical protein CLV89_13112 [Tritonibacter scottomollicae]|uniref:Uncharacterized protein n=1 Tax=Tritonibacter scottomollicae TaxID=483013 RepID=A0A2T1A2U5_TRISK|nr:hypothetical protein CLV89_13112 [Tritonibacter scottomollicae]